MKKSDIVVGVVVVALLGFAFYRLNKSESPIVTTEPNVTDTTDKLEDLFGRTIPDDVPHAELTPTGEVLGSGVVYKEESAGQQKISFLVDLPEPSPGQHYQGWVEENGRMVSLGELTYAKGGYLLESSLSTDSGASKVFVTKETSLDNTPETTVLEGSF